jgi:hypothetical protein
MTELDHSNAQPTVSRRSLTETIRDVVTISTPILIILGVIWYGVISLMYAQFYTPLAVDPSEVGLSYAAALTSSIGTMLTIGPLILIPVVALVMGHPYKDVRMSRIFLGLMAFLIIIPIAIGFSMANTASRAARSVQKGIPVYPPTGLYPLAIRADPAVVTPAINAKGVPAIAALHQRSLLYLGQANGIVVLYDFGTQQAVRVPATSVVLNTINCRLERPMNKACNDANRILFPK